MEREDDAARLTTPGARRGRTSSDFDALVTATINASVRAPTAAGELARWIRTGDVSDPRALPALSAFFHDVPLGTQVAFLEHHHLDEDRALALARQIELTDREIPLASRNQW